MKNQLITSIFDTAEFIHDDGADGIRACLTIDFGKETATNIAKANGFDIKEIRDLQKAGHIKNTLVDDQVLHLLFDRQVALDNFDGNEK